jgi:hypothetical protein
MGLTVNAGLPATAREECAAARRRVREELALAIGAISIPLDVCRVLCVCGEPRLREDVLALLGGRSGREAQLTCGALLMAAVSDGTATLVHADHPTMLPAMAAWIPQHAAEVSRVWSQLESAREFPRAGAVAGAVQAPRAEWSLLSNAAPVIVPVIARDGSVVALPVVALQNVWFKRKGVRITLTPSPASAELFAALDALSLHNPLRSIRADAVAVGGPAMWPARARALWLQGASDDEVLSCRLCLAHSPREWAAGLPDVELYMCIHNRSADSETENEPLYVLVVPESALRAERTGPSARVALVLRSLYHLRGCYKEGGPTRTVCGKLREVLRDHPMTIHGLLAAASVGQLIPFCSAAVAAARSVVRGDGAKQAFRAEYTAEMQHAAADAYIKTYVNFDTRAAKNVREELARNKLLKTTNRCLRRLGLDKQGGDHPTNPRVRSFVKMHRCLRQSAYRPTTSLHVSRNSATASMYLSESMATLISTAADWNRACAQPRDSQPLFAHQAAQTSLDDTALFGAATLVAALALQPQKRAPDAAAEPEAKRRATSD